MTIRPIVWRIGKDGNQKINEKVSASSWKADSQFLPVDWSAGKVVFGDADLVCKTKYGTPLKLRFTVVEENAAYSLLVTNKINVLTY